MRAEKRYRDMTAREIHEVLADDVTRPELMATPGAVEILVEQAEMFDPELGDDEKEAIREIMGEYLAEHFGDRLRWVVEEKLGVTQREAAEWVGVDRCLFNRWICEPSKKPHLKNIVRCAKVLGVSKCWLIFGEGEPEGGEG